MKRGIAWGVGVAVVLAAVGTAGYRLLSPRIVPATAAQIEAILPSSLSAPPLPNPQAVARYRKLAKTLTQIRGDGVADALVGHDPKTMRRVVASSATLTEEVMRILGEGPISIPADGRTRFGRSTDLKTFMKLLVVAEEEARLRKDRKACADAVVLGLRFSRAIREAGGMTIDGLVAMAIDAMASRAAYNAEFGKGLDAVGRKRVLTVLEVGNDGPILADDLRREFRTHTLPPIVGIAEARSGVDVIGTLDPLATAKLLGTVYGGAIENLRRPRERRSKVPTQIGRASQVGLPDESEVEAQPEGFKREIARLRYRMAMNALPNTIGRGLLLPDIADTLPRIADKGAAHRALVRTVLLLRSGDPASLADPFGKGTLRIDPKRRLVWSVGENGVDDDGKIGTGGSPKSPDYGYAF